MDSVAAPSMTEPTVDAAVAEVGAGDAGFDTWAAERSRSLLIFATAVTGDREAAHDAVQDALVAVYLRWRRLIVGGEPDAYARRVIVNRHISWWRRLGRRERLTAFDVDHAAVTEPAQDGLADTDLARRLLAGLPAAATGRGGAAFLRRPGLRRDRDGPGVHREHRALVRAPGPGAAADPAEGERR